MQNHFITSYIGLGSNIGNKKENILKALSLLSGREVLVTARSHFYVTSPVDYTGQEDFVNCVVKVQTSLTPHNLLKFLKDIEQKLGRIKTVEKGPRVIDLDILLYDGIIQFTSNLKIPHPSLHLRRFVLMPLVEIEPNLVHPLLGLTVSDILKSLEDDSRVELLVEE